MTLGLTEALAIAGGVFLAGLGLHGWWQQRRLNPRRREQPPAAAVEPREPTLDEPTPADPAFAPTEADPAAAIVDPASVPAAELRPRRAGVRLDALIDAIAPLAVEVHLSGELALGHLPATRRAGRKPFAIEGLNAESGDWEPPLAGARYREFQAGVQMANRTGAINEIEYSEFVQKVQAFADAIGALPDFPDMLDVVARARELDAFAGEHDAQLAVHLRPRGAAWSVGYLQQQAAAQGFVPGLVPGRLVLPGSEEGAPPVLTIGFDAQAALAEDPNQAALRDIVLSFDVPQTPAAQQPFEVWRAAAQALSVSLEAWIVDDQGRALGPEAFDAIGAELGQLYDALAARDLAAGSAAARRLFS